MVIEGGFASIARYLRSPLVLVGFGLMLFFKLAEQILSSGLLSQIGSDATYHVIVRLLNAGFWLILLLLLLGFGLAFMRRKSSA